MSPSDSSQWKTLGWCSGLVIEGLWDPVRLRGPEETRLHREPYYQETVHHDSNKGGREAEKPWELTRPYYRLPHLTCTGTSCKIASPRQCKSLKFANNRRINRLPVAAMTRKELRNGHCFYNKKKLNKPNKKLLQLTGEYSKVTGYKANVEKSVAFHMPAVSNWILKLRKYHSDRTKIWNNKV